MIDARDPETLCEFCGAEAVVGTRLCPACAREWLEEGGEDG